MTNTIERVRAFPSLPEIDDATRREFLIGLGSLLILAPYGCGGSGSDGNGSGETRTVEDYYGEVELPASPQRLVPGYTTAMDYALVLGIPMAAGTGLFGAGNRRYPEYQREAYPEKLEGLERVQTQPEANYEQIAAQQPDCILDQSSAFDENRYEQLSRIAPTFAYNDYDEAEGLEYGRPVWRRPLREIGRAFGAPEKADEFIAGYEARAADLRDRLAERWSAATFAFLEPNPEGLYVHGTEADPASLILFDDLGMEPAAFLTRIYQELSLETLADIDADVLLLSLRPKEGSLQRDLETVAPYVGSPLWQKIPAVEKDQVYRFDAEIIYTSPLCARAFLEFVEKSLL